MDFLYLAYYLSLFAGPIIFYVAFLKKSKSSRYSHPAWYYTFKKWFAISEVKKFQDYWRHTLKYIPEMDQELPQKNSKEHETDSFTIYACDSIGNHLTLRMDLKNTLHMDVSIEFRSACGKIFKLPNHQNIHTYSVSSRQWRAGGLYIEILNPFRSLRITYNGLMVDTRSEENIEEFVNFSFFWNAGSEIIYHPQDVNVDLLADGVARESWRDGEWINMLGEDRGFEQYGVLHGHFNASSFSEEMHLYLPSWRRRRWGPSESLTTNRDFIIFGLLNDGTVFCIGAKSLRIGSTQLRYGSILYSNGELHTINSSDISLEDLADNKEVPSVFTFHFEAGSRTFKCVAHVNLKNTSIISSEEEKGWMLKTTNAECDFNSDQAKAIVAFWYKKTGSGVKLPPCLLTPKRIENPQEIFAASLESTECLDISITGGKGNSLALLTSLKSNEFIVPPGFVVTVTSFKQHLKNNQNLEECLQNLQCICCGKIEGNPQESCLRASELFTNTPIDEGLSNIIRDQIKALEEELGEEEWSWAVRSSGIGEDSDELSAAGQNSTFLGCESDEDVLRAIAACWGSLFAFQSVEYRRQHGIPIICEMGVVVQKMVPAESAGVLFTCHPATGDPSRMIITANYGLGESVVSASADPDTITLTKTSKGVNVHDSSIGGKKTKIVLGNLTASKDGIGTTEAEETDQELAGKLSITEEQAIQLGKIGVLLEKHFGNPRDIEWAFCKGQLYLLQSRPVTTLSTWSDWELQHEFDTPIFSQRSLYTRANVGEVIKGAVTPLTQSLDMEILDTVMQREAFKSATKCYRRSFPINSHFIFLDVLNFMYSNLPESIQLDTVVTDLAIFGHKVLDEDLLRTALERHGPLKGLKKLKFYLEQLEIAWISGNEKDKAVQFNETWTIKLKDYDNPRAMFEKIEFYVPDLDIVFKYHSKTTRTSIFYQMIAMIVLAEKHKEFNSDHYHDISLLLATNSDVESAEVPVILEGIAAEIRNKDLAEQFIQINPKDGMKFLDEYVPESKKKFDEFLKVHGHRAFREFEVMDTSWDMQPEIVISMIQSNCVKETTTKKVKGLTVEETISKLISPRSNITKSILKFFVRKCRTSVAARETTKSVLIKTIHKFRLAYTELGTNMVTNGYIPHKSLVFFFTRNELRTLFVNRDPTLVLKAIRRQRLYEKWNSFQFPELSYGVPIPEQELVNQLSGLKTTGSVKVQGTPVCRGNVIARACVITDIKDVNQLQPGDILVTISTDIAWSPYFPILSGVVTEIGGLISHGAVVAREYGLPCVVGAQHSTKYFKTGDNILLDGKAGLIELIS